MGPGQGHLHRPGGQDAQTQGQDIGEGRRHLQGQGPDALQGRGALQGQDALQSQDSLQGQDQDALQGQDYLQGQDSAGRGGAEVSVPGEGGRGQQEEREGGGQEEVLRAVVQ